MSTILGIDQGGTHTRAAICNTRGQILGVGRTAGACHSIHGMDAAMQAVAEAARLARSAAGVGEEPAEMLFAGMTGADWPDEYPLLTAHLLELGLARKVQVVNDCIVALRGGTQASYGAIVIAGTGANCAILSPSGEQLIYHYYVEPSLQGGEGLGRRALAALYRSETGREPFTPLTQVVLSALSLPDVDALLRAQVEGRLTPKQLQSLAPLLFQTAAGGDLVAQNILEAFAAGLAELVTAGLQRFSMTDLEVEVVVSGSIFKGLANPLPGWMAARIRSVAPAARLVNARYEPVVGALLLGLEALSVAIDDQVTAHIEHTGDQHHLIRVKD